jgi:hypothetical protein
MNSQAGWWERLVRFSSARKGPRAASARVVSEVMFHELMAEEIIRSERSEHRCRVLIVYFTESPGTIVAMKKEVSRKVMGVLSNNLRKTDSVGWYYEEQIIGALLTIVGRESSVDQCHFLEKRLHNILKAELAHVPGSIQVTVCGYEEADEFVRCENIR